MKKLLKYIPIFFFAVSAIIALTIGSNFSSIQSACSRTIDRAFPVTYNIEYRNGTSAPLKDAPVYFTNEKAVITFDRSVRTIPLNDAVFTCTQASQRSLNVLRSGLLFSIALFACLALPIAFAYFGIVCRRALVKSLCRGKRLAHGAASHSSKSATHVSAYAA